MIYVSYEDRAKALKKQVDLDMIEQLDLQKAVELSLKLDARAVTVALTIAELTDEIRDVEKREWHAGQIMLVNRSRGDREPECYVSLTAYAKEDGLLEEFLTTSSRAHGADEYDTIVRRISFPTRYLYTTGWLDEVKEQARRSALRMAEYRMEHLPSVDDLEARVADAKKSRDELQVQIDAMKAEIGEGS
jgi:hypothetical protein